MRSVFIIGDVHWKSEENHPHNLGLRKLFPELQKICKGSPVIFTADYFDDPTPHWNVYEEAMEAASIFDETWFIKGNHDESKIRGNSLKPFRFAKNVKVVNEYSVRNIGGYKVALCPYFKPVEKMHDFYSSLEDEVDFPVCHFSPPGKNFGGKDEILLKMKAKIAYFYGHVHSSEDFKLKRGGLNHVLIGVPQTTRNGEQHFKKRIIHVVEDTYKSIDLPIFFDIQTLSYGEEPANKDFIYNIMDAPSVDLALEKYKEFNIRKEGVRILENSKKKKDNTKADITFTLDTNLKKNFSEFSKEYDVSEEVSSTLISYLK